jgi:hypothetical protein
MEHRVRGKWITSTRCDSGACVQVKLLDDTVSMRDSKCADGPVLRFSAGSWTDFLAGVRAGDFQTR